MDFDGASSNVNEVPLSLALAMAVRNISSGAQSPPRRRRPGHRRRELGAMIAIPVTIGLLAASAVVWQTSRAAFSGTTDNAANSWAAGSVSLSDDDSAAAMFAATGLVPGSTGQKCIRVTYGGSVTAALKLYVSANSGVPLQSYIDLVIEEGTGTATFASCTGFTSTSTLYTGTLAAAATANNAYASGWSSWSPTGATQNRTYRFSYTLNAATPDAQQGNTSTATFQWEARTP
jgi:hypothetical protein